MNENGRQQAAGDRTHSLEADTRVFGNPADLDVGIIDAQRDGSQRAPAG